MAEVKEPKENDVYTEEFRKSFDEVVKPVMNGLTITLIHTHQLLSQQIVPNCSLVN
jgi:hypothetical protein